MSTFVMSDKYPQFVRELVRRGHRIIPSECVKTLVLPEQKHADMQILNINNDIFILRECAELQNKLKNKNIIRCKNTAGEKYPANILLNFLCLKNTLYGKISAIDPVLKGYCLKNNIKMINVNQGYCRCSTAVVSENAAITADKTIEKAFKENGADVLTINPGNIDIDGFNYGFIGGASGKIDDNTIIFFGNLKEHPDYLKIKEFCKKHNVKIDIICPELPLTDIGGIENVG